MNVYPSTLSKSIKKERSWRPLLVKRISSFSFKESGSKYVLQSSLTMKVLTFPGGLAVPAELPARSLASVDSMQLTQDAAHVVLDGMDAY